ncbi:MAG: glycosyltransferase family 4 protein [Deltaproteobacteria bacterium]|nr:glycosyltransferase family 4 protein [Deltaproteobacteria bacterium]MBW2126122.1 glycosyltransferase family 4 protein [Deltaproteobacteria bacterium]
MSILIVANKKIGKWKTKMRILVVTPTFLPIIGGAEIGIYEMYKRLSKHHDVRILTPSYSQKVISMQGAKDEHFSEINFEVCRFKDRVNLRGISKKRILGRLIPPFSISFVWAVFKQIKMFQPNLINFHYVIPGGLALVAVRMLTRIPVVLSLVSRMDVLRDSNPYFRRYRICFLAILKLASEIIANSRYYFGRFSEGMSAKIIPYGVNTKRYSPEVNGEEVREKLGIDKKQVVLFALQRLVKVKNVDVLIRSLKYILGVYENVVLVISGKGPEEASLRALVKQLNLDKNIIITGYVPENELPKYFAMSDIFVLPSPNETFGVVISQAMASGKPIVSVNSSALPEVVRDGIDGILAESCSPKDFATAVIRLLSSRSMLEECSRNGRRKALEKYDWDIISQQYEEIFEKLTKRTAP